MTTIEKINKEFKKDKIVPINEPIEIGGDLVEVMKGKKMNRIYPGLDGQAVLVINGVAGDNFSIGKKYISLKDGWTAFLPAYNYH